jgi:hypothetical protein
MQNDDEIQTVENLIGMFTSFRLRGERNARSSRCPIEREIGKSMIAATDTRLMELYEQRVVMIAEQEAGETLKAER